jgi:peptide/nickel transport system substrate-binding protein
LITTVLSESSQLIFFGGENVNRPRISKEEMAEIHPHIPEAYDQLTQGRISRREFMRMATLLGMSVGVASVAAACGTGGDEPEPTTAPAVTTDDEPEAMEPTEEPAATGGPKRGGTLRVATQVPAVDHPARFSWVYDANQFRHVFEYLAETDQDNITHPYLLESWEANDDLTVWTLKLRPGIKWTNGDDLIAEHVKFNFAEWLNPDVGSSILGLWEGFLTIDGVEVVDDLTLRLNLDGPMLRRSCTPASTATSLLGRTPALGRTCWMSTSRRNG